MAQSLLITTNARPHSAIIMSTVIYQRGNPYFNVDMAKRHLLFIISSDTKGIVFAAACDASKVIDAIGAAGDDGDNMGVIGAIKKSDFDEAIASGGIGPVDYMAPGENGQLERAIDSIGMGGPDTGMLLEDAKLKKDDMFDALFN